MRNILIVGPPGVGKTTLIRRLSEIFKEFNALGFYTTEIRAEGERVGFSVAGLYGDNKILAHHTLKSNHRVGRYRVDVKGFDKLLGEIFEKDKKTGLYIIDEIGKMESLSKKFCRLIVELLNAEKPVIATIAEKGTGIISEIKKREDVKLVEVTLNNRDLLLKELTMEIRDLLLE